jgi:hypothetical protein
MRTLDDVLIDEYFQRWSDAVQSRCGVDCFSVASCSSVLAMSFWAVAHIFLAFDMQVDGTGWVFVMLILVLCAAYVRVKFIYITGIRRQMKHGTLNPLRASSRHRNLRYMAIGSTLITLTLVVMFSATEDMTFLLKFAVLLVATASLGLWAEQYFLACTPLPPKPEIRKVQGAVPQPI